MKINQTESVSGKKEESEFRFEAWERLIQSPENMAAALFILAMAVYYLWRMLFLTPWYDELYTYYYFISRGPLYAAIHWPLPNNHVGYSVLSSVLNLTGNSYIGLRGISWLCAVSNLIILYKISQFFFDDWLPLCTIVIYSSLQMVNVLSVQGRGYTLSTLCFLLTMKVLSDLSRIGYKQISRYVFLIILLTLGLYTVPSSVYWVVPLCFATILYLIINGYRIRKVSGGLGKNKYLRQMIRILTAGVIAAFVTTFLYLVIWLAVGSNLIMKDENSSMYGLGHVDIILRAPLSAAHRGLQYMLSSPYIQSVPQKGFLPAFGNWVISLNEQFLPGGGIILLLILIAAILITISGCVFHFEESHTCFRLLISCTALFMPLMLLVQRKLPYYRVFSYYGIIVALSISILIQYIILILRRLYERMVRNRTNRKNSMISRKWHVFLPVAFAFAVMLIQTVNPMFFAQLGERENLAYQALLMANLSQRANPCVCDTDQQYLMKFGWDLNCDNTQIENSDCVILDRNMLKKGYKGEDVWKFYQTYESIPWDYINTMHIIYENKDFVLYVK